MSLPADHQKPLRDFLPFVLPVALIGVLVVAHAMLFWYSSAVGESGLYVLRGKHYVEVMSEFRAFLLGTSFLIMVGFAVTSLVAWSLWQHKKVLHELWKQLQDAQTKPNQITGANHGQR